WDPKWLSCARRFRSCRSPCRRQRRPPHANPLRPVDRPAGLTESTSVLSRSRPPARDQRLPVAEELQSKQNPLRVDRPADSSCSWRSPAQERRSAPRRAETTLGAHSSSSPAYPATRSRRPARLQSRSADLPPRPAATAQVPACCSVPKCHSRSPHRMVRTPRLCARRLTPQASMTVRGAKQGAAAHWARPPPALPFAAPEPPSRPPECPPVSDGNTGRLRLPRETGPQCTPQSTSSFAEVLPWN